MSPVLVILAGLSLACALLSGIGLFLRVRAWRRLVGYDTKKPHHADFDGPGITTLSVHLRHNGFKVPALARGAASAFLEMPVRASFWGSFFDPVIHLSAPGLEGSQHLERGSRGNRWINVTRFLHHNGSLVPWVGLEGHHVVWEQSWCRLLLCQEKPGPAERVLVIAPHPDDAEIAAFGLYSGTDSTIVTLTTGDASDRFGRGSEHPCLSSRMVARLRQWDSIHVPLMGEHPPRASVNLCYPDGCLEQMKRNPSGDGIQGQSDFRSLRRHDHDLLPPPSSSSPTWQGLVDDLAHVVKKVSPAVIVTPHPCLDAHPDHRWATAAVCEAVQGGHEGSLRFYLYVTHPVATELHPFGPAGSIVSLPPCLDGSAPPSEGFYVHPLTEEDQTWKHLALEAMHDLREVVPRRPREFGRALRGLRTALHAVIHGLGTVPTSYFRRAVRPEEVFLVASLDRVASMVAQLR